MNNMPKDWTPPAPAWQSLWNTDNGPLICGVFAIQDNSPGALDKWAQQAFNSSSSPELVEQGQFVDRQGTVNYLYIAYWHQREYLQWWQQKEVRDWWNSSTLLNDNLSVWREIFLMPFERFETLHSSDNAHGVAKLAGRLKGPIETHGYSGAARDRVPCAFTEDISNNESVLPLCRSEIKDGGRRVLVYPPKNMCIIRSGQDWGHCDAEQKEYYLSQLHPVLIKGMNYLSSNPKDSHCLSMRLVNKTDSNWQALEESFGLGHGNDIYAFENWAKSHPTHLAIFDRFLKMVEKYNEQLTLQLWHEVTVIPEFDCEFEYINCHAKTGLLPYT